VAGVIDSEFPAIELVAVESIDGVFGVALVAVSDKGEPSRLSAASIFGDVNVSDFSIFSELSAKGFAVGTVGEVVDFEGNHPLDIWRRPPTHFSRFLTGQC